MQWLLMAVWLSVSTSVTGHLGRSQIPLPANGKRELCQGYDNDSHTVSVILIAPLTTVIIEAFSETLLPIILRSVTFCGVTFQRSLHSSKWC